MHSDSHKTVHELESRLRDQSARLETYEKLEKEMDDVVLQAAESGCSFFHSHDLYFLLYSP